MIHLDLFSGIGGFALGLQNAGFKFKKHFYSEVDKHAIANYTHNFKTAEYVGSVTDVPRIESIVRPHLKKGVRLLITFGSPCQDFSLAGKRSGMEGQRSVLIKAAFELIRRLKPDVYIWENVKGAYSSNAGADYWGIVQAFTNIDGYRLEQQLINTAWVLPQNRERIYLIGHLAERSRPGVFPFGKDDKVFSEAPRKRAGNPIRRDIANCLMSVYYKTPTDGQYIKVNPDRIIKVGNIYEKNGQNGDVFDPNGLSPTLRSGSTANKKHGGIGSSNAPKILVNSATTSGYETATEGDSINLAQPNSQTRRGRVGKQKAQTLETSCNQAVCVAQRGRLVDGKWVQHIEARSDTNTNTLTAVEKDNMVLVAEPRRTEDAKAQRALSMKNGKDHTPFQGREIVFEESEVMNTITRATQKDNLIIQVDETDKSRLKVVGNVFENGGQAGKIYDVDGCSPTVSGQRVNSQGYLNTPHIRRLTEIEYERLQGFPDNWTEYGMYPKVIAKTTSNHAADKIELLGLELKKVSRTQRYKLLGNAVTATVVQIIGERLLPIMQEFKK